jgi:hypothetical protein
MGLHPAWSKACNNRFIIMPGELTTVPKNAKIDRCIIIEPTANTFMQLAIGSYIKRRLKDNGCDLYDQTKNKHLAYLGSVSGDLATIDLSSASDTVAMNLVLELLPPEWFNLLESWRTGQIFVKNHGLVEQQKFSSMGNGYTFELESLIFYSLSWAVCTQMKVDTTRLSCYGDDIIIPTICSKKLYEVLSDCGFIVNTDKSYTDGSFRESCGSDFLSGINIRPFYFKDRLTFQTIVSFLNFLKSNDPMAYRDLRHGILSYLPKSKRLYGRPGFGDGHLHTDHDFCLRPHKRNLGYSGYVFSSFIKKPKSVSTAHLAIGSAVLPSYACDNLIDRKNFGSVDLFELFAEYIFPDSSSSDFSIVRGGFKEKRTKIYVF